MIKSDIVDLLYENYGFTKAKATEIVEKVLDTIKDSLRDGNKVQIHGFGTFLVRNKNERIGRKVKTGEEVKISPRRSVTFRSSRNLRSVVDNNQEVG